MPAQISILDLLHTIPLYQEILDNALHDSCIPIEINITKFHNLVDHLFESCALSFKTSDILAIEPNHILPLHIAIMVFNIVVISVMIGNGLALDPCTCKFIKQVGYIEVDILN